MSWLKRNPEELRQRLTRDIESDREFYQSLPRTPVGSRGSGGSSSHSFSSLGFGESKDRSGSLHEQFRDDMEIAWGNPEEEEEVMNEYISRLYRGKESYGRTKEGAERTVKRWRKQFQKNIEG